MKDLISIIVITKNEQFYVNNLILNVKNQTYENFEIIISDNQSTDNTLNICKQFDVNIVNGGIPSTGRNRGAYHSKGTILLFLDADATLSEDFLANNIGEFIERDLDIAITLGRAIQTEWYFKFLLLIANFFVQIIRPFKPHGGGANGIVVRKEIFDRLNGFNEKIFFDDVDFIERASKMCRFGILKSERIGISFRRFKRDGIIKTCFKVLLSTIFDCVGKKIPQSSIPGGYDLEKGYQSNNLSE